MQKIQPFDNQESPGFSNRIYPEDDKPMKTPSNSQFQISQRTLIDIIKESQKRKFCEEVDKLEQIGGFSLLLFHESSLKYSFFLYYLGDAFIISAVGSDLHRGIPSNPSDLLAREGEYGHNRKQQHEQESYNFLHFFLFLIKNYKIS